MNKVLILASVASMIDQFNMENISLLKEQGLEVHVAANFEEGNTSSGDRIKEFMTELKKLNIPYFHVDFSRKVTDIRSNIRAYNQIKKLTIKHQYKFIHCHSPIGGVCGRLVGKKTKTPVIYTAHGFHFFKGASFKNWLIYYPIERFLAKYTNVLITINKEDFEIAKNFKAKNVVYIPGIGIDIKQFNTEGVNKENKRKELGIPEQRIILLSVGELSKRKNHEVVIRALAKLENPQLLYVICGQGELENYLKNLSKKLNVNTLFLGFRKDITEICGASDLYIFPSLQEGLPVALMEAMAAQLPIVCSNIRGNNELIENGYNGFLVKSTEVKEFAESINEIINDLDLSQRMGSNSKSKVNKYDIQNIREKMKEIYQEL